MGCSSAYEVVGVQLNQGRILSGEEGLIFIQKQQGQQYIFPPHQGSYNLVRWDHRLSPGGSQHGLQVIAVISGGR